MNRILVVEDEEDIREILNNYLTAQGYAVTLAGDGVEGIAKFHDGTYDLILLDVLMPKIDGFGVCELIRRESDVPIIMLTALEKEEYQIRGLDLKADDYITKPFSMPVLLRKIAAVLRRTRREEQEQEVIRYEKLLLDIGGHHVYICGEQPGRAGSCVTGGAGNGMPDVAGNGVTGGAGSGMSGGAGSYASGRTGSCVTGGAGIDMPDVAGNSVTGGTESCVYGAAGICMQGGTGSCVTGAAGSGASGETKGGTSGEAECRVEVMLTQKEFELLHVLLINKGIVLTRQKLLNMVWGMDYFGEERIVDTHIKNIRKKLGQDYIRTIRGVGYRIDKEDQK